MTKITYRVNGGKIENIVHGNILQETDKELTVRVNDELNINILKSKITERENINEKTT